MYNRVITFGWSGEGCSSGYLDQLGRTNFGCIKHNYLLMFGSSNKKVTVENNVPDGATKEELAKKAVETFHIGHESFVMQVWDKDFEEYVDIPDCDRVLAPVKIRIVQVFPVKFSADLLESGGTASIITLDESKSKAATETSHSQEDNAGLSACSGKENTGPSRPGEELLELEEAEVEDKPEGSTEELSVLEGNMANTSGISQDRGPLRTVPLALVHFKMPTQPPTIEKKLRDGCQLKLPERSIFLQNIYETVVEATGTRLPTRTMYDEIVNHMFIRYPCLAHPQPNMPIGNMKTFWKDRLLYKFRNNRKREDHFVPEVQAKRKNRGRSIQQAPQKQEDIVRQWGMPCYLPPRPPSEDDGTIKLHEEFLQKEKKKRQPDYARVKLAMDKTFSNRREWLVISQPRPLISAVKERYPWLFDDDQMTTEMMRLQDTSTPLITTFKAGLKKYAAALLVKGQGVKKPPQCFVDSRAFISAQRVEEERQDATCKAALLILPKLLREDISHIFVGPDVMAQNPVHLRMNAGSILESSSFILIADEQEVATANTFFDAVVMWLSSYYIFNLGYEKVTRTLCFIQRILLKIEDQLPIPKAVATLTNELNQLNMHR